MVIRLKLFTVLACSLGAQDSSFAESNCISAFSGPCPGQLIARTQRIEFCHSIHRYNVYSNQL